MKDYKTQFYITFFISIYLVSLLYLVIIKAVTVQDSFDSCISALSSKNK